MENPRVDADQLVSEAADAFQDEYSEQGIEIPPEVREILTNRARPRRNRSLKVEEERAITPESLKGSVRQVLESAAKIEEGHTIGVEAVLQAIEQDCPYFPWCP